MFDPGGNRIELMPREAALHVALIGEIDYAIRDKLDDAYAALTQHPPADIIVDLADTSFLGSVGLGFLVQIHRWVTDSGHQLSVDAPPRHVRRALMLTGLDQVLTVTGGQQPSEPSGPSTS